MKNAQSVLKRPSSDQQVRSDAYCHKRRCYFYLSKNKRFHIQHVIHFWASYSVLLCRGGWSIDLTRALLTQLLEMQAPRYTRQTIFTSPATVYRQAITCHHSRIIFMCISLWTAEIGKKQKNKIGSLKLFRSIMFRTKKKFSIISENIHMDLVFAKRPDKGYMIRFNRVFRNSNGKSGWTKKYSTVNVRKLGQDSK